MTSPLPPDRAAKGERKLPPLFGVSTQPYACERWMGTRPCGAQALYHIIWDDGPDLPNGSVCEEHALEAIETWEPKFIHPQTDACGTPGAGFFFHDLNTCGFLDAPA